MALEQFTAMMGVTAATVWRWRQAGELDVCNIHGRLYVLPESVEKFNRRAAAGEFAKHHVTPSSPAPTRRRAAWEKGTYDNSPEYPSQAGQGPNRNP